MAATKVGFMAWVLFVAAVILLSRGNAVSGQCPGSENIRACIPYVHKEGPKIPPSQACCDALGSVDILCICHHLPPDFGNMFSFDKVMFVLQVCKKSLPPGTQCGSYTVPPVHQPLPTPPAIQIAAQPVAA